MEGADIQEESRSAKRQKTIHQSSLPAYQYDRYTVAWVCALHIEMAAAQAMLDEVHDTPPRATNDTNSYVLGRIKGHNVVIACLPNGYYGTINAATVAANISRTFPAISVALMVGIGGGVPSKEDIRLGDIVVGTRVMQYDLGKIMADGKFERTAFPRTHGSLLGTTISSLRAKHELGPSRVPFIIEHKMKDLPDYCRPNAPDRLFDANYEHRSSSCDECDSSKLVNRARREPDISKVHYGAIASGDQVMKHGSSRDNIARELDVICFEMEAAGLMDIFPCLPIRGVCDYSDSHKTKEWQKYAAAAAAAYARELMEELPLAQEERSDPDPLTSKSNQQGFLDLLKFDQIDSRKLNIKKAHSKTCQWLLDHPQYKAWLDPTRLTQYYAFLWLSGKPGAGKSTIMKFAFLRMKKKVVTASFFFNARGEYLERSVIGMYRSLLYQLLMGYPELQKVLDKSDSIPLGQEHLSLNVLKDIFYDAVSALGQRHFVCFVDALDECDEQQIRDMIDYFEDLGIQCMSEGIPFRVCFSSRHYPYISIQGGIKLTLESETGHTRDLEAYITNRLRIQDPFLFQELKSKLLEKAAGVFMWVILVVDILNKEWHRGGLALRKRLAELPSGLSELFRDILRRDTDNMDQLLLCIRWIMFAERPLQPDEFRHALWSNLAARGLVDNQIPTISPQLRGNNAAFIISSSKGLAEITMSSPPKVQFIHESVRDFLIKDNGFFELWPELENNWEASSHDILRECCDFYLKYPSIHASCEQLFAGSKLNKADKAAKGYSLSRNYPFLQYASQYVLHHSNAAAIITPQNPFLLGFQLENWIVMNNIFEKFQNREYGTAASLLYILADRGLSTLIRTTKQIDPHIHFPGERYVYPIFAALAGGHKDAVAALLGLSSTLSDGVDIAEGINFRKDLLDFKRRTPLTWAAQEGRLKISKHLIEAGMSIYEEDEAGETAFTRAIQNGHKDICDLLFEKGSDINLQGDLLHKLLSKASESGHKSVARLFIEKGANINFQDSTRGTALFKALHNGHETVARLLIEKGADVHVQDSTGATALFKASNSGHETIARLLIEKGANIHVQDSTGATALFKASNSGHETIARLLIEKGANIHVQDSTGATALFKASNSGHETIARLLIEEGANVHVQGSSGRTALFEASQDGHEAVARLLIEKGANVHVQNSLGRTALFEASRDGHEAIARLLIEKGANVHVQNSLGRTALFEASRDGHEAVARLLIDKGAHFDFQDSIGVTALVEASYQGHERIAKLLIEAGADVNPESSLGRTPLYVASVDGHTGVAKLLIDNGAQVDRKINSGKTPLYVASAKGRGEIVKLLLDNGAQVDLKDDSGRTPLYVASRNGHGEIVKLLLDNGAAVDIKDNFNKTPLCEASANGCVGIVKLLLDNGADVDLKDYAGRTPLYMASCNGHREVVKLLLDSGTDMNLCDM
ncbi:hypothetical protein N7456_002211 [Penicillium angulare]|uniref:Nucleoside phosphorylase domain-containing protein n=1 Tax=Penicillium angulare TaxID=116970 RepID=A0A9W9G911_9EURO|nr:hypothetical protein N7456_002211 [Penicillium angulare]